MRFTTFRPRSLPRLTRDLNAGLPGRLSADEQFNSFTAVVDIDAGAEVTITNQLRNVGGQRIIPGEWAVIDAAGAGIGSVVKGDEAWTTEHLHLKNTSDLNGQFRIRFTERPRDAANPSTAPLVAPSQPSVEVVDWPSQYARFSKAANQTVPTNTTSWQTVGIDTEDEDPSSGFSLSSDVITVPRAGYCDIDFFITDLEATAYLGINLRLYNTATSAVAYTFNQYQIDANVATGAAWPRRRILIASAGHTFRWEWKTDSNTTTAAARGAVQTTFTYVPDA